MNIALADVDIGNDPLLQLLLEGGDGDAGPDAGWDHVVVLQPPVRVAALSQRFLRVEVLPIPDATIGCLPCSVRVIA